MSKLLIAHLPDSSNDYAAVHIAQAMGKLKYTEFIEPLINAIGKDRGDFICDAAQKSLCEIGHEAQAALISQWDELDSSQQIYGLSVIRNIHGTAANEFSVNRFSDLLKDDLEYACGLFLVSPDIRLVNLLKPELRRKQSIIDRAFYILAKLMEYDDPIVDSTKERALADYDRSKNAAAEFEKGSLAQNNYLNLELKCPACEAVNQYQTKGVIMSVEADAPPLLADEFPCLSCAKEVEFQFTSMAQMAITAELLKKTMDDEHSQNSKVNTIDCKIDGQVIPLSKALLQIDKSLAIKPDDAYQWFRLGNLISQINRPKATINAYQKATTYAPNAADAQFALASALFNNQQEIEAFQILQDALKQLSEWTFFSEFSNFGHTFADLYNHLRRSLGKLDIPAVHPSALSRPKKLGRNDPCSCGSGKKFKKCCGR